MTTLALKAEWTQPGFVPDTLYDSPFVGVPHKPRFDDVAAAKIDHTATEASLESFAADLLAALRIRLKGLNGPIHCLLSGGYDSRILATLLERAGKAPLYVTDGTEEPQCGQTLDLLEIPAERRYVHDMSQPDPYGLTDAVCEGWAPLYSQLRFFPDGKDTTLVTGLGGGEWFSYPADGWHNGKKHRVPHDNLVNQWLDCWPQYALLPDAWASGYKTAAHPYCAPAYARVAARCRPEWLVPKQGYHGLDSVRHAMLEQLDERLAPIGWVPHDYDWNLTDWQKARIDMRYAASWVAKEFHEDAWGWPSEMDNANHACTMAGFASWCEQLIAAGHTIEVATP